jgi:hypothetical protein
MKPATHPFPHRLEPLGSRRYVWTCPPSEVGRKPYWCNGKPCRGHTALAGDVLVARALAWASGVDWFEIDMSRTESHDTYLRQARRFRFEVMGDERRPR